MSCKDKTGRRRLTAAVIAAMTGLCALSAVPRTAWADIPDPAPVIAVVDGNTVIAVDAGGSLLLFTNPSGTVQWNGEIVVNDNESFISSAPSVAQDGNGIIIAVQGPDNNLLFYWRPLGSTTWTMETVAGANTTFSAPSLVVNGNGVNIVAEGPGNSLDFYWAANGTTTWHQQVISGDGTTYSAPSMAVNDGSANVAVQGAENSLLFYWQADGTATWHAENVAGSGTTYSGPAITANSGSADIAAEGPGNSLQFYWNINGTSQWTPESVPGADVDTTPSITTDGEGVYVAGADGGDDINSYYNSNGSTTWQDDPVCTQGCGQSAPAVTVNSGVENIAVWGSGHVIDDYTDTDGWSQWLVAS
jgi:hypothetical protein